MGTTVPIKVPMKVPIKVPVVPYRAYPYALGCTRAVSQVGYTRRLAALCQTADQNYPSARAIPLPMRHLQSLATQTLLPLITI